MTSVLDEATAMRPEAKRKSAIKARHHPFSDNINARQESNGRPGPVLSGFLFLLSQKLDAKLITLNANHLTAPKGETG
jgi:hypothetical protein